MSSVHDLIDLQAEYLAQTETYLQNEYKRLDEIRRFIEQREKQNAEELAVSYTESSINAFKTILRIKTDWELLKNDMAKSTPIEFNRGSVTKENINSALRALRRLQIVYELEVHEIANGNVSNYTFEKLDVNDCHTLAVLCYDNAEFHCAYHWFDQVNKIHKEGNSELKFDYEEFLTKYIWSSYLVGDIEKANTVINDYMQTNYLNEILTNVRYIVYNGNRVFKRNTANDTDKKFYSHSFKKLNTNGEVRSYTDTCQNWNYHLRYTCRHYYGGNRKKSLLIGPLREENVALVPNIKLYHNVLNDDEINKIKQLAKPELKKLPIDTNEDISLRKVAEFDRYSDEVFQIIHRRLALISCKSKTKVLNKFVVTNYGIHGHYLPHSEYIDNDHKINSYPNREAIVIIHLDDVPEGGFTVLPDVNVRVPSIKGSALVIYNTRNLCTPFGMLYENAQYGSCPIFYGDKWTLTAWFGS
ncbi:Hypothetical protein CINCED_3A009176 [Cinara cedri]|nr:Hypothetical protein CINCED_3A009176 [Cinara cedri]